MKKIRNIFISTAILLGAVFALSCTMNAAADMGDNVRDYSSVSVGTGGSSGSGSGSGSASSLYKNAAGFDIAVWGSWQTKSAPIAEVSNGADGGVRLTSIERPDDGTYFGVNLAAGSGSGANADLNGNGFKQINCKLRGTVNTSACSIYIINGSGDSGSEVGKTTMLSTYVQTLSETEWTEITVTGLNSTSAMSSGIIFFADNDGADIGDWVEIKEIDWQNASGESVVPTYNN